MATWDDVHRLALALPDTTGGREGEGSGSWRVRTKAFVWERPLRASDRAALTALGRPVPDPPILGAHVPDLGITEALVGSDPDVYFTTPHFDGYAAVLVRLPAIDVVELGELVTEAWLCRAPKRLAARFLADQAGD
jgi:hypothetical protein